jgi:tetrahydromethanopterin S-methyltransferase subunit C
MPQRRIRTRWLSSFLLDTKVTLAGADISTSVASVTLTTSVNEVETTAFGQGAVTRVGGLKDNSVTLAIHNDYPTVENLVYPLIGSTTSIVISPNGTSIGSGNP